MKHGAIFRGLLAAVFALSLAAGGAEAGLQAWWTFDEGGGSTVTDGVSGNVGTLLGNTSFSASVPGALGTGSSLAFDGNDAVRVPDSPSVSPTGNITLSAWVNTPSNTGTRNIVAKDSNNAYRWRLNGGSGELWALVNDGGGLQTIFSGATAPTGGWHHTAVSVDFADQQVRFYLDGSLVATKPTVKTGIADTGGPLVIGAYQASGSEGFNGNIDDVAIYGHRLSNAQIAQLATGVSPASVGVTVLNPSFEADAYGTWPGYSTQAGNGPITGWTMSTPGNTGINPTAGGSPFANNGAIPDGSQVAFIQRGPNRTLSQTAQGFEPGEAYIVTYRENARGDNSPVAAATLGGQTVVADHTVTPVDGANPYRYVGSALFTATADAHVLSLANNTPSGDHTVLYDDVAIHQMHLLFADNFDVLEPSYNIQPGSNDEPGRQGGSYAPLTYAEKSYSSGSQNHLTQLDNGEFPDALLVAAQSGYSQTTVSPNANFNNLDPTDGGHFLIECKVNPTQPDTAGDWAAIIVGSSSQTPNVNNSDGVGFLIRGNGGYQIFDGTDGNNSVSAQGDLGLRDDGWYDVRVNYWIPELDDVTRGGIAIFVDDLLIYSAATDGGFANNYVVLEGYGGGALRTHGFDDLRIWSSHIPEPTTLSLLALGGLALLRRRKRRW